jgi:hypothetical protein
MAGIKGIRISRWIADGTADIKQEGSMHKSVVERTPFPLSSRD